MSAELYLLLLGPALAVVAGLTIYLMARPQRSQTPAE
jgi:hypothetical protein